MDIEEDSMGSVEKPSNHPTYVRFAGKTCRKGKSRIYRELKPERKVKISQFRFSMETCTPTLKLQVFRDLHEKCLFQSAARIYGIKENASMQKKRA